MLSDVKTRAEAQLLRLMKAERSGDFIGKKLAAKFRGAARKARKRHTQIRVTEEFINTVIQDAARISVKAYLEEYNLMRALVLAHNEYDLDLGNLRARFLTTTGRPIRRSIEKLSAELNSAIRTANHEGRTETERVRLLRARMKRMGLLEDKPSIAQAWLRTATSIAANGARWDATQINPTVWGYTYVTMRDDRVRPEHRKLDGYTRKKDDPAWETIWPPNGWNCRCQVVPVEKQRQSRVNHNVEQYVDEEFRFNAGEL